MTQEIQKVSPSYQSVQNKFFDMYLTNAFEENFEMNCFSDTICKLLSVLMASFFYFLHGSCNVIEAKAMLEQRHL